MKYLSFLPRLWRLRNLKSVYPVILEYISENNLDVNIQHDCDHNPKAINDVIDIEEQFHIQSIFFIRPTRYNLDLIPWNRLKRFRVGLHFDGNLQGKNILEKYVDKINILSGHAAFDNALLISIAEKLAIEEVVITSSAFIEGFSEVKTHLKVFSDISYSDSLLDKFKEISASEDGGYYLFHPDYFNPLGTLNFIVRNKVSL